MRAVASLNPYASNELKAGSRHGRPRSRPRLEQLAGAVGEPGASAGSLPGRRSFGQIVQQTLAGLILCALAAFWVWGGQGATRCEAKLYRDPVTSKIGVLQAADAGASRDAACGQRGEPGRLGPVVVTR